MNESKKHRHIIMQSHERSLQFGVDKERVFPSKVLQGNELFSRLIRSKYLLKIAAPFMDILYEAVANSGFFILLTDDEGCILRSVGDPDSIEESRKLNMVVGAYMDEKSIGTNAMGTAISEDKPLQVTACEHFISAYSRWTCSAAPIHDCQGMIIGTLNLTGASSLQHPHTLGLVVAAVRAIENQIKAEQAHEKSTEAFHYLKSVVESVSAGIITIDLEGKVKTLNQWACSLLNLKREAILEQSVAAILPTWDDIYRTLGKGEQFLDNETIFTSRGITERFDLSAYPIRDHQESIIGMVLVMKGLQKIFRLVNKYSGMRAHYTFEDIIGKSPEIRQIIDHARKIANTPSTVLLMGESGTGKELIAQSIHNASARCNESFIAVNCGALPKDLIESELFGYEEGAFTGSKRGGNAGKFELANGGTIFLDEIGEMPLDMQVNLLRVLQEGYVTRIGGNKNVTVDVRVIAATKKNLVDEMRKGTFREDLFYRLSVIPLFIPPLRERGHDVQILFHYFLKIKANKLNKPIPHFAEHIFEQILRYSWPGNVRELENFVENLVNFNGMSSFNITPGDHGNAFHDYNLGKGTNGSQGRLNGRGSTTSATLIPASKQPPVYSLEEIEKLAIRQSMDYWEGNVSRVSRQLGISRTTLYSKMKKYQIAMN